MRRMGKYSKKLLSRVQEHQVKKILDNSNGNLETIQEELAKIGLGDFVHKNHITKLSDGDAKHG